MPGLLVGIQDMIFSTRILGVARQAGVPARCAGNLQAFAQALRDDRPALVLLDMSDQRCPALDMLRTLRESPGGKEIPAIAFFSHVEDEVRRAAVEAGCDEVMPRSQFVQELPALVAKAQGAPPRE